MISRRSLFSLIPTPFAAGLGLLTTSPEPTEAPDSDELAVAAMAFESTFGSEAFMERVITDLRRDGHHDSAEIIRTDLIPKGRLRAASAERDFRERLALARGVSIVVGGKVYTAVRSRGNHLVKPVWVAMLTPSEGGGR